MGNGKKCIVITGVSRGLGQALARRYVELGHTVLGCARSTAAVEQLACECGAPHRFTAVDVADWQQVQHWAQQALSENGPPDLLINNAAIVNENAPLWEVAPEQFSQVVDVNIKGVFHVVRAFLPGMVARGSGVIVNFSSYWGRSTSPEVAPYCATKWAIEGLTQALAQELPSGLAAVPMNPGIIDTEMLQSCFGTNAHSYPGPDEWVEQAAPFLLSLGPRENGRSVTVPGF